MYLDEFVEHANKMLFGYEEPVKYLTGRGFTVEDIKKFRLGFLKVAKIKKENSNDYKTLHDLTYGFRTLENRIIIPLKNILGKTNGLVVRSIKEKKYNLYLLKEGKDIGGWFGLCEALPRVIETRKLFIHEGAFNSIAFSKIFSNTASTLTSFMNEQQYEFIRMFADKLILIFDEDKSGKTGVFELKKRYGKCIESIMIGYDDVNSCLQRTGLDGFSNYIKRKIPFLLQN